MSALVQYIIVNGSIHRKLNWPIGAIIAQCCHAATAVGHLYADDADTATYYKDLDNMHKVVLEVRIIIIILIIFNIDLKPFFTLRKY